MMTFQILVCIVNAVIADICSGKQLLIHDLSHFIR